MDQSKEDLYHGFDKAMSNEVFRRKIKDIFVKFDKDVDNLIAISPQYICSDCGLEIIIEGEERFNFLQPHWEKRTLHYRCWKKRIESFTKQP